jgi:hypothetical protein
MLNGRDPQDTWKRFECRRKPGLSRAFFSGSDGDSSRRFTPGPVELRQVQDGDRTAFEPRMVT